MNEDVLKGRWEQVKGRLKERWGRFTDDDLKRIEGSLDQVVGRIQERYGLAKDAAEREWHDFVHQQEQSG